MIALTKNIFNLLSNPSFGRQRVIFEPLTIKLLSTLSDVKKCNIQESEWYMSILDQDGKLVMDKIVRHILHENILVPEVALNNLKIVKTKAFMAVRKQANDVSEDFKVGRYSPKDNERILANFDQLLKDSGVWEHREALKGEILEKPDSDQNFPWKMNILGHYLSQGLHDIRLPCDVANKLRNHLLDNERKLYTREEDEIIKNFMMENEGKCQSPFSELAVILGRSRDGIARRYKQYLKVDGPRRKGPFSNVENKMIMDAIYEKDENAHRSESTHGQQFWQHLGKKLNRPYDIVRNRWNHCIAPTIVMYEEGVLDVDFSEIILDYCVENGIEYSKEANWSEIRRLPQFHGLSSSYLSYIYSWNKNNAKQSLPQLANAEVTSQVIQEYNSSKIFRSKKTALENPQTLEIIDHYNNIKMKLLKTKKK